MMSARASDKYEIIGMIQGFDKMKAQQGRLLVHCNLCRKYKITFRLFKTLTFYQNTPFSNL